MSERDNYDGPQSAPTDADAAEAEAEQAYQAAFGQQPQDEADYSNGLDDLDTDDPYQGLDDDQWAEQEVESIRNELQNRQAERDSQRQFEDTVNSVGQELLDRFAGALGRDVVRTVYEEVRADNGSWVDIRDRLFEEAEMRSKSDVDLASSDDDSPKARRLANKAMERLSRGERREAYKAPKAPKGDTRETIDTSAMTDSEVIRRHMAGQKVSRSRLDKALDRISDSPPERIQLVKNRTI
jgi:hypothetical protein